MEKSRLLRAIIEKLQTELDLQTRAAHMAREEATSEESRAENKYDTRGQEAAYLAEGQAKQAAELHDSILLYQSLNLPNYTGAEPIGVGALVTVTANNGRQQLYFLGPRNGGLEINVDEKIITLVTPQSPLGRQLSGAKIGHNVVLPGRNARQAYEIVGVE